MTTTATFDLATDDPELRALVNDVRASNDQVLIWTVAVFVCTQMRDRALRQAGASDYQRRIVDRARATREARKRAEQ